MDKKNLAAVRETFGRLVYTHKTYEKASDICSSRSKIVKFINILLLVITSGSALGSIFSGTQLIILTSIFATISLFFVIYQYNFNFEGLAYEYKATAKKLWLIREKYQNFIADIMNERYSAEDIAILRDSLLLELNEILSSAPSTDNQAYQSARKAIRLDEEMTFANDEINQLLPADLRID